MLAGCAIDVDHKGGKAVSAKHHVLFDDWESLVDVRLIWVLSFHKIYKAKNKITSD